jgi:O-antigen ligase
MFLGALMVMLLVAAALQLYRRKPGARQMMLFLAALAAVLVLAGIVVAFIADERNLTLVQDLRPAIWKIAIRRIGEHPWTGTGYGRLIDQDIYQDAFPNQGISHPHNLFLGFAEEAGLFGALAIAIVFLALGREYWRLYRSDVRALNHIGIAGLAMLCGVLAKNMTDMFFVRESALLFWSLHGMLLGYARHATMRHAAPANAAHAADA